MKIFAISVVALLTGAAAVSAAETPKTPDTTGDEGRYQMFQGKYQHWNSDLAAMSQKEDLFMIDTTNGQSWVYMSSEVGGKETRYWFPSTYDETRSPLKTSGEPDRVQTPSA